VGGKYRKFMVVRIFLHHCYEPIRLIDITIVIFFSFIITPLIIFLSMMSSIIKFKQCVAHVDQNILGLLHEHHPCFFHACRIICDNLNDTICPNIPNHFIKKLIHVRRIFDVLCCISRSNKELCLNASTQKKLNKDGLVMVVHLSHVSVQLLSPNPPKSIHLGHCLFK